MRELKNSINLLFTFILAVLGIAQVQYIEEKVLNLKPEFFILFAVAIGSELLFVGPLLKRGVRISVYFFLILWGVIYGFIWMEYFRFDRHSTAQVLLVQFIFVEVAAGLSYEVGKRLGQVDKILGDLSSNTYPNRTKDIHVAHDVINDELTRCRRYHHPLALLAINLERDNDKDSAEHLQPIERDMLEKFASAKVGQILNELSRGTDIILQDHDGLFVLLCPETEYQKVLVLADRLSVAVMSDMDAKISWGIAMFPDDALNFKDLLQVAKQRIPQPEVSSSLTEVGQLTGVE